MDTEHMSFFLSVLFIFKKKSRKRNKNIRIYYKKKLFNTFPLLLC